MKQKKTKRNQSVEVLHAVGHKATPVRLALIEILRNCKRPMAIEAIWKKLGKKRADQATVYRAIHDLMKSGMIRRVEMGHAHAHYELADTHHHHIICVRCGITEDIKNCNVKNIEKEVLKQAKLFSRINTHSLEFFSLCGKCGS